MASMKDLLNNKKISDKRVIFKYTDYDVMISAYSIYDVLCLQAKTVKTSPENLEYGKDGAYQTDTIEITAEVFVTCRTDADAPYSQQEIQQLPETELYFNLEDVTLTAHSTSNIVYFGKTLWVKSTKKDIDTDAATVGYGQSRSVPITVSADIDDNAELQETSAEVVLAKFFAAVAGNEYYITGSDCSVEVTNTYEAEKDSILDALAKSYQNAEIAVALSTNLKQYFADGSNAGADDVAVIEYIVKMLTLETISSYNNAENWAERLGNLAADTLKGKLLSKLGLSSSAIGGTDTVYAYAQYTGTNGKTIDLKIPVAIYMLNDKIYGGTGSIFYSMDGKAITDTRKVWENSGDTLTYTNMKNFADCMVDYVKIAYDGAWGKNANKCAEYLIGQPLANLFGTVKTVNSAAKILGINVRIPTSASDAVFKFTLSLSKKTASIECPVDVYVYNSAGQVCGAIENNEINPYFSDENVVLRVDGDKKYVTLYNDDYRLLLVGNDSGKMKYQIDEYADGELVRSVTTVDIPLEEGTAYHGSIPESLYTSIEIYELVGKGEDVTIPVTNDEYFVQDKVSGTVTSHGEDTQSTTISLIRVGEAEASYQTTVSGSGAQNYSISGVEDGDYTLRVEKQDHVTREYEITVSGGSVEQKLEIYLLGDINGDGKVTTIDAALANSHARGVSLLEGYALACADTAGNDGKVTTIDVARINAHAREVNLLW